MAQRLFLLCFFALSQLSHGTELQTLISDKWRIGGFAGPMVDYQVDSVFIGAKGGVSFTQGLHQFLLAAKGSSNFKKLASVNEQAEERSMGALILGYSYDPMKLLHMQLETQIGEQFYHQRTEDRADLYAKLQVMGELNITHYLQVGMQLGYTLSEEQDGVSLGISFEFAKLLGKP